MAGWDYDSVGNKWVLRGKGGDVRFGINDDMPNPITGMYAFFGTSAAVNTGTNGIMWSSVEGTIPCPEGIHQYDIVHGVPGTTFPANSAIAYFRTPKDKVVNFGISGSIGVMNWYCHAFHAEGLEGYD